jgi:hypothetical protein
MPPSFVFAAIICCHRVLTGQTRICPLKNLDIARNIKRVAGFGPDPRTCLVEDVASSLGQLAGELV